MEIGKQLPTLLIIQGPTASGKTSLAIELALYFETEIISADARQFYCEMSIGTAKPTEIELSQAKHHFINSHSIHQSYTASNFAEDASLLLDQLFETNKVVILVGGSNLYIDALINGVPCIFTNPQRQFSKISEIENPSYSENILYNLAYWQWNVYEMKSGEAWSFLTRKK